MSNMSWLWKCWKIIDRLSNLKHERTFRQYFDVVGIIVRSKKVQQTSSKLHLKTHPRHHFKKLNINSIQFLFYMRKAVGKFKATFNNQVLNTTCRHLCNISKQNWTGKKFSAEEAVQLRALHCILHPALENLCRRKWKSPRCSKALSCSILSSGLLFFCI